MKKEKGITLVALILTIVILLILAVVTINSIQGEGIISKAMKAREDYEDAAKKEQGMLDEYLQDMEGISSGTSQGGSESGDDSTTTEGDSSQEENIEISLEWNGTTLKIGDKVEYNEGTGKSSSIDSNFAMKDLEWRVLGISNEGNLKLISTQPTDSKLKLSGQTGWLNVETNLDTLCNNLYGSGTGAVGARSLKVEDINILGNYDPTTYSDYGVIYQYGYETGYNIRSRTSRDNGNTWSGWNGSFIEVFTEPGEESISSSNPSKVTNLTHTKYGYYIPTHVTNKTAEGISMADLITQGLNDENNAVSGTNIKQWLSSRFVDCDYRLANFSVHVISGGSVDYLERLWCSTGITETMELVVRPVVYLSTDVSLTKVGDVWQINS